METVYAALDIDEHKLIDRFGGIEALAQKYLFRFPDDPNYPLLCEAVKARDYTGVEHHAHTLKGISSSLELHSLSRICDHIVCGVRAQKTAAALPPEEFDRLLDTLMADFDAAFAKVSDILRR